MILIADGWIQHAIQKIEQTANFQLRLKNLQTVIIKTMSTSFVRMIGTAVYCEQYDG